MPITNAYFTKPNSLQWEGPMFSINLTSSKFTRTCAEYLISLDIERFTENQTEERLISEHHNKNSPV